MTTLMLNTFCSIPPTCVRLLYIPWPLVGPLSLPVPSTPRFLLLLPSTSLLDACLPPSHDDNRCMHGLPLMPPHLALFHSLLECDAAFSWPAACCRAQFLLTPLLMPLCYNLTHWSGFRSRCEAGCMRRPEAAAAGGSLGTAPPAPQCRAATGSHARAGCSSGAVGRGTTCSCANGAAC